MKKKTYIFMLSDKDRKRHVADLNEALTLADKDINENWERYKDWFLGRMKI